MNLSQLVFNDDGTIDPAQLEGLPEEVRARLTSPEFIARARVQIAYAKKQAELRRQAATVRALAAQEHEIRRPSGLSGRQRKRLRKAVRRAMKIERAKLQN